MKLLQFIPLALIKGAFTKMMLVAFLIGIGILIKTGSESILISGMVGLCLLMYGLAVVFNVIKGIINLFT